MKEWRRHNGGDPCPVTQGGQRIQVRIIGRNRASILRAWQADWGLTFEWRFAD